MSSHNTTNKKKKASIKDLSNSLDWDSPSTKTGTVKRRPSSIELYDVNTIDSKNNEELQIQEEAVLKSGNKSKIKGLEVVCRSKSKSPEVTRTEISKSKSNRKISSEVAKSHSQVNRSKSKSPKLSRRKLSTAEAISSKKSPRRKSEAFAHEKHRKSGESIQLNASYNNLNLKIKQLQSIDKQLQSLERRKYQFSEEELESFSEAEFFHRQEMLQCLTKEHAEEAKELEWYKNQLEVAELQYKEALKCQNYSAAEVVAPRRLSYKYLWKDKSCDYHCPLRQNYNFSFSSDLNKDGNYCYFEPFDSLKHCQMESFDDVNVQRSSFEGGNWEEKSFEETDHLSADKFKDLNKTWQENVCEDATEVKERSDVNECSRKSKYTNVDWENSFLAISERYLKKRHSAIPNLMSGGEDWRFNEGHPKDASADQFPGPRGRSSSVTATVKASQDPHHQQQQERRQQEWQQQERQQQERQQQEGKQQEHQRFQMQGHRSIDFKTGRAKAGKVSDTDSGIASPLSPSSTYSFPGLSFEKELCKDAGGLSLSWPVQQIKIYTDWANHYLEKARSKRKVNSLATDCSDGVLLAEVIESVTCQKIPDINRKPKTPAQMLDNINSCLGVLRAQHVSGVEQVSGQDLREGRLKAILALFFALSRHKQATKQRQQQLVQQNGVVATEMTPNRSTAIPHSKGGSAIPLPGSALPARRCPPDKVRPVAGSSRASSPALSMIPRAPPTSAVGSPYHQGTPPTPQVVMGNKEHAVKNNSSSMLDKLKLFKNGNDRGCSGSTGKRTSSSSGVSSARSERSDSSISLAEQVEVKVVRSGGRVKQQQAQRVANNKVGNNKGSPNASKKEINAKGMKTAVEVERHANKVSKLIEPKGKAQAKQQQNQVGTGIPKPTAAVKGTTKILRTPLSREPSQQNIPTNTPKPTVGIVSPMKNEKEHSVLSESSHSASTGQHSNSSESSVIYKPSSESGSEQNIIPNRKETLDYISEAPKPIITHETEEKVLNTQVLNCQKEEKDEDQTSLTSIEPMRPLFRGYCSTLTLPSRQRHNQHYGGRLPGEQNLGDYCEVGLANGYLSDGEVLRNMNLSGDICDGYMSEGGTALYARSRMAHQHQQHHTIPAHVVSNGSPRISPSLTVLTEQGGRRGTGGGGGRQSAEEPPPPPTGPRRPSRNGSAQFPEGAAVPPPGAAAPASATTSPNGQQQQQGKHPNGQQWKRYTDSPGVGSPPQPPPPPAPSSPTGGRRERRSSPHGGSGKEKGGGGGSSKVRGVPQSFGYVKRGSSANGHSNGTSSPQNAIQNQPGKTAQVSAVPRTKVKVSGGTQTCSSDLQPHKAPQFKSYSLTGNAASQLSQSVRERLMGSQSLPKGTAQEYSLILRQQRPKASDGSLSDTQAIDTSSPYAPWLRHSNTYSVAPRLSETDSMESLTSLPGHRGSLTHARLLRDSPSRLSRSNSIRSTKSEKLYPSMLHRNTEPETEPYYCLPIGAVLNHWSQPTSPAPGSTRTFPLSPTHSNVRHSIPKNDDIHGSSISLVSTASSLYSSAEEKQAHEIRKLRRELIEAQEKVKTLTSQLSTNAHVVSAFEQSLSSMTQRLQHLTATSEKKDSELAELRAAMESLRTQSIQAGIGTGLARQPSSDSVSSLSSACSLDKQDKKKKKGWLRSSFTKAFSRNAKVTKVQCQTDGDHERAQSSPPPPAPIDTGLEVAELQKQLREKDLVLTDIRLEALSSAHQLESLKDTVMKMRSEMLSLKQNNERLQRMVSGTPNNAPQEMSNSNSMDPLNDLIPTDEPQQETEPDGKRIAISVYLGQPQSFHKYYNEHYENDGDGVNASTEIAVAHASIGAATSWAQLDNTVRRAFKQHVARLDPGGGLGLGSDSVALYKLGDAERASDSVPPDLLPVGYVVGRVSTLHVVLQPVAALAFEALIPKGVAQRLVSLLSEHRRLVLCGAPGTGKTHLATRLAEFHAQSLGRDPSEAVATFNVDNKSGKELRQYLAHLSEQAAAGDNSVLPCVVVLDNLHKAGPLADALGSLPRNLPCLLGTMAQSACSATSLQLQHGFRWVLVAPHMEPARGLLGRVLRRRLASLELEQGPQPELAAILGWLPRVWQHLNAFLETHSSGDVAIGPRLFLSCPLELDAARAWFADVWNYSLAPYLREAAREGLQLYGRRAAWTDPSQFVLDTYPWPGAPPQGLTTIPAKDVGLETGPTAQAESDGDPLLNMLMRLQEAANYSSPHSNDSDCNSLDSNLTHNSNNLGTESVS